MSGFTHSWSGLTSWQETLGLVIVTEAEPFRHGIQLSIFKALEGVCCGVYRSRHETQTLMLKRTFLWEITRSRFGAARLCYRALQSTGFTWLYLGGWLAGWNRQRVLIICNGLQRGVGQVSAEVSTPLDSSSVSQCVIVKWNSGCTEPLCIGSYCSHLLCSQLETRLHLDIGTLTLSGESKEQPLIGFTAARPHI